MPHYRSITIQRPNGKWYNIRSVFPGSETPVSDRRAEALGVAILGGGLVWLWPNKRPGG